MPSCICTKLRQVNRWQQQHKYTSMQFSKLLLSSWMKLWHTFVMYLKYIKKPNYITICTPARTSTTVSTCSINWKKHKSLSRNQLCIFNDKHLVTHFVISGLFACMYMHATSRLNFLFLCQSVVKYIIYIIMSCSWGFIDNKVPATICRILMTVWSKVGVNCLVEYYIGIEILSQLELCV